MILWISLIPDSINPLDEPLCLLGPEACLACLASDDLCLEDEANELGLIPILSIGGRAIAEGDPLATYDFLVNLAKNSRELTQEDLEEAFKCPKCVIDKVIGIIEESVACAICDKYGVPALRSSRNNVPQDHLRGMPDDVETNLDAMCELTQNHDVENARYYPLRFMCDHDQLKDDYAEVEYARSSDVGILHISALTIDTFDNEVLAQALYDILIIGEDYEESTCLWVHELKHIEQFKKHGIDNFCKNYLYEDGIDENCITDNECSIEAEAYALAKPNEEDGNCTSGLFSEIEQDVVLQSGSPYDLSCADGYKKIISQTDNSESCQRQ